VAGSLLGIKTDLCLEGLLWQLADIPFKFTTTNPASSILEIDPITGHFTYLLLLYSYPLPIEDQYVYA
jgi:hypothetical protein